MPDNNLPPGLTTGMLPGFRREDDVWERLYDEAASEPIGEYADRMARGQRGEADVLERLICQRADELFAEWQAAQADAQAERRRR